ncbi:MAG: DUF4783 domain-containing protein [Marinilabiliales bacterium]|nr:MAG: DUF4783 domain-containing protein [Marinilabiliales bacterium]
MKRITISSLILFLVIFLNNVFAFQSTGIPDGVDLAIKSGNASELAKHFNSSIEIAIFDDEDIYSKNQAEQILKTFFSKHSPSDFKVVHEGGQEGAKYFIGDLTTNTGTYRTYFLIKTKNNKPLIHTFRIENEE